MVITTNLPILTLLTKITSSSDFDIDNNGVKNNALFLDNINYLYIK